MRAAGFFGSATGGWKTFRLDSSPAAQNDDEVLTHNNKGNVQGIVAPLVHRSDSEEDEPRLVGEVRKARFFAGKKCTYIWN